MKLQGISSFLSKTLNDLIGRRHPEGGFGIQAGGMPRPDATAWAVLALTATGHSAQFHVPARRWLTLRQQADGRISVDDHLPHAIWPTPLAIMAWQGDPAFIKFRTRALQFMLSVSGRHWPATTESRKVMAHDTAIKGWPWVLETHSWIEPTSLAVMAIGQAHHPRVQEAVGMILDRQLPQGGWNYGNTKVFGQSLRPMPETTGVALTALRDKTTPEAVDKSVTYLKSILSDLKTPLALGWALLGLSAWNQRPSGARTLVAACLDRQKRYGPYDTVLLSLMVLAAVVDNGQLGAAI